MLGAKTHVMKMTHSLARIAFAAALLASPLLAHAADTAFLKEVDDLPLAPGLVEVPGGTLFDAAQGRIVEASAQGRLMEIEVRQFYDESLPQLGWTQVGSSTYRRDKEELHIDYTEGMPMTVHFSLAPAKAAAGKDKDKDKDLDKDQSQSSSQDQDERAK
jgi:hypothetical protein